MKWVNLYGGEYAYCDDTERIVGSIFVSRFDGTVRAYCDKEEIGRYVTESGARTAVELKTQRTNFELRRMTVANHKDETMKSKTFRLTEDDRKKLDELAAFYNTDASKLLRAFIQFSKQYPNINSALRSFL